MTMAKRPAWTIKDGRVVCEEFNFVWNSGFSVSQKQKNICALHKAIFIANNGKAIEISTKSKLELGREMSAFLLKSNGVSLENIFQAAKKYRNGGPYIDLHNVSPGDAKHDERHKTSGELVAFVLGKEEWQLIPQTAFYDYVYVMALLENYSKELDLSMYNWYTDIEFNPNKSINCQARAAVIYKLIQAENKWECLKDKTKWIEFHKKYVCG